MRNFTFLCSLILISINLASCNKDEPNLSIGRIPEKFTLKINTVDYEVELNEATNGKGNELVYLVPQGCIGYSDMSRCNNVLIGLNIPAKKSKSGKDESFMITIQNDDQYSLWSVEDTYKSESRIYFHTKKKYTFASYLDPSDGNIYESSSLLIPVGSTKISSKDGRMIGEFAFEMITGHVTFPKKIYISGTFEAVIDDDIY